MASQRPPKNALPHRSGASNTSGFQSMPIGAAGIAERHLMVRSLRASNCGAVQRLQIFTAAVAPHHKPWRP